jgi:peptidoglycan/xylan/chitin deacetylase (PgdA/CDA1 family)
MIRTLIKHCEQVIAWMFYYTGLTALVIRWNQRRGFVPIVVYHSVRDEQQVMKNSRAVDLAGMSISSACFDEQIKTFKEFFISQTLEEYLNLRNEDKKKAAQSVILTFDDGFLDNYTTAVPIMEKYGLRGTFFLLSRHLAENRLTPLHEFYAYIDHILSEGRTEYASCLFSSSLRRKLIRHGGEREDMIREFLQSKGLERSSADGFMNLQQAKELAGKGHEVACHGYSHVFLIKLKDIELKEELERSRMIFQDLFDTEWSGGFTYPYGVCGSTRSREKKAIKEKGFLYAATTEERLAGPKEDVYGLPRIQMDEVSAYVALFRVTGIRGLFKRPVQRLIWSQRLFGDSRFEEKEETFLNTGS